LPEYLPQLIECIRENREDWIAGIDRSIDSALEELLGESARAFWHDLPVESATPPDGVIGTDGSQSDRILWSGSHWWVVRAVALCGKHRTRLIDTGIAPSGLRDQDFQWYLSVKMEELEHKTALEGLKQVDAEYVLLDGSLFGRLQHPPVESPVPSDRFLLLDYFDTILDLLEYCRNKNIGIIAVSKDSRARHLVRHLARSAMNGAFNDMPAGTSAKIRMKAAEVLQGKRLPDEEIEDLFTNTRQETGKNWRNIERLVELGIQPVSDHVLMQYLMRGKGYTSPLLLSMNPDTRSNFMAAFTDSMTYSRSRFRNAIKEAEDQRAVRKRISATLKRLERAPAIVSFHTRLHPRDTPLRIDLPSWMVEDKKKLWEPLQSEEIACNRDDVFEVLTGGYGGLQNYNIWQVRADAQARLSRETVDSLYRDVLEKELGMRIEFERGYRRVYYP